MDMPTLEVCQRPMADAIASVAGPIHPSRYL